MSDTVIHVEHIWKQYQLGTISHNTLKADLASWWARMRGREDPNLPLDDARLKQQSNSQPDRFWALKDINFEVKQGEVLGIIGKNGAGKSTLLKILSRVTTPTRGQIKVKGRIASLLEVGTGFHPELTGRENIFLNGAILGMNKVEIRKKLDEIIDFAEVEKFVDTPVKRYSSGMYVRLAFAVAAHLEPEILVVDEVLAVGDAEFQKKCLGKMGDVASNGRTILFVSHNMGSIKALCSRCAVIDQGRMVFGGDVEQAVSSYYGFSIQGQKANVVVSNSMRFKGTGLVKIEEISILDSSGQLKTSFLINEPIKIKLKVSSTVKEKIYFWLFVTNENGDAVISSHQGDVGTFQVGVDQYTVEAYLADCGLMPGGYKISMGIFGPQRVFLDWVDGAIAFKIEEAFQNGKAFDHRLGFVDKKADWTISEN